MRRITICLLLTVCLFTGCGREPSYWQQELPQLAACTEPEQAQEETRIYAVWIPVMQYAAWMTGNSEKQFRVAVSEAFANCASLGINTVFVHVRAYGDAYYRSALFPKGSYLTGDYDPLAIMTEEAHDRGLAVHAWVNPLRCQAPETLAGVDPACRLRQWYDDSAMNGTRLVEADGHFWLNPAYPETRQLAADGIAEILTQYDVDGIHIDDYFYPTQDPDFDAQAFAESGAEDLGDWRRGNCTALVQLLYETVKAQDPACIFSISPQGNLGTDREQLYADAALWSSTPGCCDWIVPQIYYGFRNGTCPFAATLRLWEETASEARLVVGLAAYKIGEEDPWAGSGSTEWQTDGTVLSRELALTEESGTAIGAAFYSYEALFAPAAEDERERIRACLTE